MIRVLTRSMKLVNKVALVPGKPGRSRTPESPLPASFQALTCPGLYASIPPSSEALRGTRNETMNFRNNPILPFLWVACSVALLTGVAVANPGGSPERGFTSRMVTVLNGLPEPARARVVEEMRRAAGGRPVFNSLSRAPLNAGVTQSSRNWRRRGRPIRENRAIRARYQGPRLVFDYRNPASRVGGSTARPPGVPGYRIAVASVPGLINWKGVEYFVINRTGGWYHFRSPFGHQGQGRHRLHRTGRVVLARRPGRPPRPPEATRHGGGRRQQSVQAPAHQRSHGEGDLPGPRRRRVCRGGRDTRIPLLPGRGEADGRLQEGACLGRPHAAAPTRPPGSRCSGEPS